MDEWTDGRADQFDPRQVVPRQAFTPYSHLLISTAFVVVSRIILSCHGVTGVYIGIESSDQYE